MEMLNMNCNLIEGLRNLDFLIIPDDSRCEKKFFNIDFCNNTVCQENIVNENVTTIYNESSFEISKPGRDESVKEYTMPLIDKNITREFFISDSKFKSQEDMQNQEHLVCTNYFNNRNNKSPITDESEDSDTLIIYNDESDIDCDESDSEKVKNAVKTENEGSNFEEYNDNQEISALKQNFTKNSACESIANASYNNFSSQINEFHVYNCEDGFKKSRRDQKNANARNENISNEIYEGKMNVFHNFDSKIYFKSSMIDQQLHNIEHEDPDILKIFYDESDIDSDYKSDSEISKDGEEIKSERNENSKISVIEEVHDSDIPISNYADNSYINLLNYIEKDKVKTESNSCVTTEILQNIENATSDIDEDNNYKLDSEISGKREEIKEIKSEINEDCKITVNKEVCNSDSSISNYASSSYISLLNCIDKVKVKTESNSCFTTEIVQNIENATSNFHEEKHYKLDSEISGKREEIKSEINEDCEIIVNKEACDPNLPISCETVSSYTNTLNYIEKDTNELKADLNLSPSAEIIKSVQNTIPDYYEEEKEDLINPGWNKIKSLSTDEERCNLVAECWQSPSLSDPNKNLTYYSFRKRFLCSKEGDTDERKPLKRQASTSLNDQDAKRIRLCTYIVDDRIKSIENERDVKIKELETEFDMTVKQRFANHRCLEERMAQQHFCRYGTLSNYETMYGGKLKHIRGQFEREINSLEVEYERRLKNLQNQYITRINSSYKKRKEIQEFCSFYKVSKTNNGQDPTLLTENQQLIFNEIENVYKQLDHFYSS